MVQKLSFGVDPNMREVPPGEHALIKIGNWNDWEVVDTEWGEKYSFPIVLLQHPSYESISKKGIEWQSKSVAAKGLWNYIYDSDTKVREFDWDVNSMFKGNWKLHRTETGTYQLEQM
jgi:hypothetical protein